MLAKPIDPNGSPDGGAPEGLNAPTTPTSAALEPSLAAPAPAEQAHLTGEPDTLPPTWCRKCNAEVKPEGKGRCPRCGRMLRANFSARRHPINKLRCQVLLDKLVADYQPNTTLLLAKCSHLAGILEQLEVLKAGSQEHKRLVELSELLGAALQESLRARQIVTATSEIVSEVRRVIIHHNDAGLPVQTFAGPTGEADSSTPALAPKESNATTATQSTCAFCHQSFARCAEIKATRPEDWATLHYSDPEEIKKRDAEATAVMMKQFGRGLPDWYV